MGLVKLSVVDTATGEIIEPEKVKRKFKATWFMSDIRGSKILAEMSLSKNEYRVLHMLSSKMAYNNRFFVNKAELAKEFKCSRSMVYATMELLEKKEIIIKIGSCYKFNNTYVRCGGAKHEQ